MGVHKKRKDMSGPEAYCIVTDQPMTIAEFSRIIGIHPSTVQYWRRGQSPGGPAALLLRCLDSNPDLLDVYRKHSAEHQFY